jgi:hypothetical protein
VSGSAVTLWVLPFTFSENFSLILASPPGRVRRSQSRRLFCSCRLFVKLHRLERGFAWSELLPCLMLGLFPLPPTRAAHGGG